MNTIHYDNTPKNMDKFNGKYRIPSARLQGYNYAQCGAYFITICTKDRIHYFGEIDNGIMHLNELGKTVETEWMNTIAMRPDMNLEMGEFVVMPNHFHAVIIIGQNEYNTPRRDAMHCVSTPNPTPDPTNQFGPQSKNLASILRGFKSVVTTYTRKAGGDVVFNWQARFHDHIIRNAQSFETIQHYIATNAMNWEKDTFYTSS